jgi:hypothetical protein
LNMNRIMNKSILGLILSVFAFYSTGLCGGGESITDMMYRQLTPQLDIGFGGEDDFDLNWDDTENIEKEEQIKSKSTFKAGALSLLLPGAGEYYLGHKNRAAIFIGAEAAIWGGYFAFRAWGDWKEDDYKSFAADHAGANIHGKDDKFFERMQFYSSRDWYNIIEGERYGGAYPYTDFYYWHWDSDASREKFRGLRNESKTAFRNATFMIGVAALNRVVSFIDAIRLARSLKKARNIELYGGRWKIDYNARVFSNNPSASIKVTRTFN